MALETPPSPTFPDAAWAQLWTTPGPASPHPDRPAVTVTMVSSVDGHVTEGGKVSSLTGPADQAFLHRLRAAHDGVLVGATTVRVEGYASLLTSTEQAHRQAQGLSAQPVLCIVSASAELDPSLPVFGARDLQIVVLTKATAQREDLPRQVQVLGDQSETSDGLDLRSLLAGLQARHGVNRLLCEGGPTLVGSLVKGGTIDELIMVVSPRLSGGEGPRIIVGVSALQRSLSLVAHAVVDNFIFLRYRVAREATA